MKNINVSWGNFEAIHTDVTDIFEQLCRILFKKQFLDDTSIVTSSPNHPGVEAAPSYSTKLGKNIAFQAKYFIDRVGYSQIQKSVDKTIRIYGKELDIFLLYCNKDLTLTSRAYKKIESDLQSANIELQIVSNNEILNQVTQDSSLQQYFFGNHTISREWFSEYNKLSFSSLNERYNTRFNVNTEINDDFELFTRNPKAIARINEKKTKFIEDVNKLYTLRSVDEIIKIKKIITSLDDITHENIDEYLTWNSQLRRESSLEIEKLKKRKNDLERQLAEGKSENSNYNVNRYKTQDIDKALEYICSFGCTEQERLLITEKIIVVDGEAGMGKSQLFATTVNEIIDSGGYALLLLGQHYLADNDITAQIMERFGFDYGFCEFLDILDVIGESENKDVYIFIDAINETPNKNIWKNGLTRIMSEIDKRKHIKLLLSVRTGYEQIVFEEKILQQIQDGKIFKITQSGFLNEPVAAIKEFLNFYDIPFSPSDLLNYEMTNPLFLTLFCKTYNGEEMNIFQMFERFISIVDKEIQTELGIWGSGKILKHLLSEIAQHQLNHDNNFLYEKEFLRMDFWSDYGIYNKKLFIVVLLRSGLLVENVNKDEIVYSFGYNLFEDYLKAQKVMKYSSEKREMKEYIEKELLKIEAGKIQKMYNIGIFLFVCCFYFKKFNEDCIDLIEKVTDESDSHNLATRYLKSFSWRPLDTLNSENFINIVKTYRVGSSEVLDILIENSVKENSPINAEFLHEFLFSKKLNERDASWTIYINSLTYEDERIFQLIYLFNEGGSINNLSKKKVKLLLTLFAWLLSSSNRKLRDVTSKAMIEILKSNFDLCEYLLRKFENVDDPYIIQRLYGVVFGACTKKNNSYENEYKSLSKFIYSSVFDKDLVYPDILLRDYARLIIEKFLVEFPNNKFKIEYTKMVPPYRSEPIPTVKFDTYSDDDVQRDGLGRIDISMRPEGVGMYGDFGRYTFQSALSYFEEVDIEKLYHYAMQYIRDELGYSNELFANYDTSSYVHHPLDRAGNHTIERIGKKYQWITFYNILARISDSYRLKENYWDFPHLNKYSGPWEPYVRDFDPTLNLNFMKPLDILPEFDIRYHESFLEKNWDDKKIQEWITKKPKLFDMPLSYTDSKGVEWILLYQFKEIKDEQTVVNNKYPDFSINNQQIWRKIQAYFVKNSEFQELKDNIDIQQFFGGNFPEASSTYQLYSREFGWSPSIKALLGDYWHDFKVKTGEKTIAKIQPAHIRFSWEEEYDASKEEQIYFNIPCFEIINKLQLHSKEYDGYFFSQSGDLVAFDGNLTNTINGLVIRKDYLDSFLKENDLSLFWACIGEKKCFDDHRIREQSYSEWSGFYYLNNQSISGEIEKIRTSDLKS